MKNCSFTPQNHPVDISREFVKLENQVFLLSKATEFDADAARGKLEWVRHAHQLRMAFNQEGILFSPSEPWEFPPEYYGQSEQLPFSIGFVSERTLRLRFAARHDVRPAEPSLMLLEEPRESKAWAIVEADEQHVVYRSSAGTLTVERDPFHLELRDAEGKVLLRTQHPSDTRCMRNTDPVPFCFVRTTPERARRFAATFANFSDEKYFGCGESFTRLNKRGQKVVLYSYDAHGVQTDGMYKPVPFFLSSRGYAMFLHTTAPATFDFGEQYDGATTLYAADSELDLFVFIGDPKQVLAEYTDLTGRSPVPPLWSFGLWMSRCTYKSEAETRAVASELRERRIPSDVVHLDTGWFEDDWRCDYRFSTSRFGDPKRMIEELKQQGFRICLWQLPYFTPRNRLYSEIIEQGLAVRGAEGDLPSEDAVLDFSNPRTIDWYKTHLASLLNLGVGAIKVDFGEAAPLHGLYASGYGGMREHNAYPLRYNQAVAEITQQVTGDHIIWARSAWAGSQRYPIHWAGDGEDSDSAMAATLRGGLSLGLSGFSFWSHDIGGFPHPPARDLYRRWLPFGMLTSHSRCHGVPPREPWAYDEAFVDEFRTTVELKYRLMPYVYAQAHACSKAGLPMLRALFVEYPADPTSWLIEDEYLFGTDLLVAPLFESVKERDVYLPPGGWIDYQSCQYYEGGKWYRIAVGQIPVVLLVRDGALLPEVEVAQHTGAMDWQSLKCRAFLGHATRATGLVWQPSAPQLETLVAERTSDGIAFVRHGDQKALTLELVAARGIRS